jgi:hypothetical protein
MRSMEHEASASSDREPRPAHDGGGEAPLLAALTAQLLCGLERSTAELNARLGAGASCDPLAERLGFGWLVAGELAALGATDHLAPTRREPRGAAWLWGLLKRGAPAAQPLDSCSIVTWPKLEPATASWDLAVALVLLPFAAASRGLPSRARAVPGVGAWRFELRGDVAAERSALLSALARLPETSPLSLRVGTGGELGLELPCALWSRACSPTSPRGEDRPTRSRDPR